METSLLKDGKPCACSVVTMQARVPTKSVPTTITQESNLVNTLLDWAA